MGDDIIPEGHQASYQNQSQQGQQGQGQDHDHDAPPAG